MFNIGGGEFLVIAIIALIVLGPQRLPDAARQVGKAMGELRRLSSGFQSELKSAFDESERSAAPTRDVLGATPSPSEDEAPGRANGSSATSPSATNGAGRPRRRTPLRADPVPDPGSPRTNGP